MKDSVVHGPVAQNGKPKKEAVQRSATIVKDEDEEASQKERQEAVEDARVWNILHGSLGNIPPLASKVVRIFISSTFTDMVCERNALMEQTYPRLKSLCKQHGLEFQVVDMRWGVPEEVQDDHLTSSLCMKEIHNCQRLSVGPTFLLLMGQKYGYRPFPANIASEEFSTLQKALLDDGKDVSLLGKWYKQDENVVPPVFSLVPISSMIPDYTNKEEPELQAAARSHWWEVFQELQKLLRHAAKLCFHNKALSVKEKEKYFISVTEDEIQHGILLDPVRDRQACFTRTITDLQKHAAETASQRFLDLSTDGAAVQDKEASDMLTVLKQKKIPAALSADNQKEFHIEWKGDTGVSAGQHGDYLSQLCETSYDTLANQIASSVAQTDAIFSDQMVVEILQHLNLCKARCETFRGREDILNVIATYFSTEPDDPDDQRQPMVVHGESGSGKTSIMAQVVSLIPKWLGTGDNIQPVVICRFLGTTPQSSGIFNLLLNICRQINRTYGKDRDIVPENMQDLIICFSEMLQVASAQRPLVIVLDALDQLSHSQQAHDLLWLPWQLPDHVYIVVSCLPTEHRLLPRLRSMLDTDSGNFVEVPAIDASLSSELVQTWLRYNNRTLTPDQFKIVKGVLSKCTLPLYTKLVYEEVSRWRSYTPADRTVLANTVQGIINTLLERVETNHGKILVSHALSYITASRNGLSEVEMEDVLSLDDVVLDHVFAFWVPPIRRIPPLLWTRIKDELSSYLVEREAAGVIVIAWYHRQFWDVTRERYMADTQSLKLIHSNMADYYIGVWGGGAKKPFKYTHRIMRRMNIKSADSHADRKLPQQPLEWKAESKDDIHYNLRKMHELPYHLLRSERYKDLITLVLMNYKWLHCKLRAMSLAEVLTDFNMAGDDIQDSRLSTIAAVLRIGGMPLSKTPNSLASEIVGRLKVKKQSKHEELKEFVEQCEQDSIEHCALMPAFSCFMRPQASLLLSLEGHRAKVADILFSEDSSRLYSVSTDGCISAWNITTGERIQVLQLPGVKSAKHIELLQTEGKQLICETYAEKSPLFVISENNLKLVHSMGKRKPGFIHDTTISADMVIREGELMNVQAGKTKKSLKMLSESKNYLTVASNGSHCFIGQEQAILMLDIESEQEVLRLPGPSMPSKIIMSADNRTLIAGYTIDCSVIAFNVEPHSDKFGSQVMAFSHQQQFPTAVFQKGELYCQEVSHLSLSHNGVNVLANVKYCHLFVVPLNQTQPVNLDVSFNEDGHHICNPAFSYDDRLVVATVAAKLCAWLVSSGQLAWSAQLHGPEVDEHLLLPAPSAGLLATVSRFDPVIRVWDMNKLQDDTEEKAHLFNNPVNDVVVDECRKLAFIKTYRRLDSHDGYHFIDHFGLDLWNLSTNTHTSLLPRSKYGQLKKMLTVGDSTRVCLWIDGAQLHHIYVVNTTNGSIVSHVSEPDCKDVQLSLDGKYMLTEVPCSVPFHNLARLWLVDSGLLVHTFNKARSPVLSVDCQHVLHLVKHHLYVHNISTEYQHKFSLVPGIGKLQTIPGKRDVVLATLVNNPITKHCNVYAYNFHQQKKLLKMQHVSAGGFRDISKNGMYAVDGSLQVFDLNTGHRVVTCDAASTGFKSLVRLTHPGCHVIWADDRPTECLKVFKMTGQRSVATVSTHSKVVSLTLADYGFTVVAGCEDGNLLIFKLHQVTSQSAQSQANLGQVDLKVSQSDERVNLGSESTTVDIPSVNQSDDKAAIANGTSGMISPHVISSLDPFFRAPGQCLDDSSLPGEWPSETRLLMQQNAHVVHSVSLPNGDQHNSCMCTVL